MTEHTTTAAGDHRPDNQHQDRGGELVPFPPPAPATTPAVGLAEPVDLDERVPVNPPEVPVSALGPVWERTSERRPVLPAWVTDADTRRAAARWAAEHSTHLVAFHAVRVPLYCGRLAVRSPRGLGRTVMAVLRWAVDAESAGLRRDSAWRGEPRDYMALLRRRDERVRARLAAVVFALFLLAVTVLVMRYAAPGWLTAAVVAGTVAVLGMAGRRAPVGQGRPPRAGSGR